MNAARIRALIIVGLLFVSAAILAKITISGDKQTHTNYANNCPANSVKVVTKPLPNYSQISLKIYNGSGVVGVATNVGHQLSLRGFKVKVEQADKPVTHDIADLYYGPNTLAAAWVVRSEFLLSDPTQNAFMHFNIKDKTNVVTVIIGTSFKQLGAKTEVNQSVAALGLPPAPAGTCVDNP